MAELERAPQPEVSVYAALRSRWEHEPGRVFLRVPQGRAWTYEEIDDLAARMATVIRAGGAAPGERVMVQVRKSPEAVALYLACLRTGTVYTPINPAYTDTEVEYFIDDAQPAVLVQAPDRGVARNGIGVLTLDPTGGGSLLAAAHTAPADTDPTPGSGSDVVAMLYTSGTTGRSKGAMLTSDNLLSNARALHHIWAWQDDDVLLHLLPIFHTHGLFVALHCAMLGASEVIFCERFDPETAIQWLPQATVMMGVPTYYHRLLADPGFDRSHAAGMRLFTSGSAPLSATAHRAFTARSGHEILERYGMTETGMITSNPYYGARVPGTVGYPLPAVEVRVVGEDGAVLPPDRTGMVEVRGPNVFAGYWQMPDKTADAFTADGFFRTGDIGSMAGDGRLTLAGRSSDMIISGGLNVYPKEVELVLDETAGVRESAVVGVPHPDLGEAVVAFVVGEAGEAALAAVCAQRLAGFKRPKAVVFVDELPRNAMGKVQKNLLRESHAGLFSA